MSLFSNKTSFYIISFILTTAYDGGEHEKTLQFIVVVKVKLFLLKSALPYLLFWTPPSAPFASPL